MGKAQLIAERLYELADGTGSVHVRLHRPEQDRRTGDWVCRVDIAGLPEILEYHEGWGVDSLEATTAALQGLAAWLEPHRHLMRWRGNSFLGLPVYVPHGLGDRIDMRLLAAVDREMQKVAGEMERERIRAAKRYATPARGTKATPKARRGTAAKAKSARR